MKNLRNAFIYTASTQQRDGNFQQWFPHNALCLGQAAPSHCILETMRLVLGPCPAPAGPRRALPAESRPLTGLTGRSGPHGEHRVPCYVLHWYRVHYIWVSARIRCPHEVGSAYSSHGGSRDLGGIAGVRKYRLGCFSVCKWRELLGFKHGLLTGCLFLEVQIDAYITIETAFLFQVYLYSCTKCVLCHTEGFSLRKTHLGALSEPPQAEQLGMF